MHISFYIKMLSTSTILTIYLSHKSILFDFFVQIRYSLNTTNRS